MNRNYEDIIHLPYPKSKTRPPMSMENRAAQFAPFSALTGYEEAVRETERLTDRWVEPDEDALAAINETLCRIQESEGEKPWITVTYFRPDETKKGGSYITITGRVRRVDSVSRILVMEDEREIPMERMIQIEE